MTPCSELAPCCDAVWWWEDESDDSLRARIESSPYECKVRRLYIGWAIPRHLRGRL